MSTYLRPTKLDEALAALATNRLAVLAGGTDYYPARVGKPINDDILDISGIAVGNIREFFLCSRVEH